MKQLIIVPQKKAASLIKKINKPDSLYYYLSDDYIRFIDLRNKFIDKIKINNLSGLLQQIFCEIREPFLELMAELNKKYNSFEWWGGQVASKSSTATPLILNITYLFCAKKILSDLKDSNKCVIFILDSSALSICINNISKVYGYKTVNYIPRINKYLRAPSRWLRYSRQIFYFLRQALKNRTAAFRLLKPLTAKKSISKKRIIIRSWINKNTFTKFKDRNFGSLPQWLRSRGYEVWTFPIFFGYEVKIEKIYAHMKNDGKPFLIPEHYLKLSDYLTVLLSAYRVLRIQIKYAKLNGIDVAPIFNEVIKDLSFNPYLSMLNLCSPMLKRLKEKGYEIDGFYYPFENNAPEKQFILSCRRYFPYAKIIGFQHTTFFRDQLAYHLGPGEKDYHPLPDKIICSGSIYVDLHKNAGFPSKIVMSGPNLRFESVYVNNKRTNSLLSNERILMVALSGLPGALNFDYSLLLKVKDVLKISKEYAIYIRSNPIIPKKILIDFLKKIDMVNCQLMDGGVIQEWLPKVFAVISGGMSITILEAVSFGTPVIRVIPDNLFFFDPFWEMDYPLKPINNPQDILQQLQHIDEILYTDKEYFLKIGRSVLAKYFTKPTEENLRVFL